MAEGHGLLTGDGWYSVLHGRPESSTGECVSQVRAQHGDDAALWGAFGECTNSFVEALTSGSDPSSAIKENQRLLERIGVVPEATKAFVRDVEVAGGVAKVCGAGSVKGDFGGAVLVHMTDADTMAKITSKYPQFESQKLRLAPTGATAGPPPEVTA